MYLENNQNRIGAKIYIDTEVSVYMRALAIVLVILGHILGGKFGVIGDRMTSWMGIGGVHIFLLLSGYGLFMSYRKKGLNAKEYWNSKIKKIFLPYAAVTIFYFVYLYFGDRRVDGGILLENLLCVDYERHMDGTMWYMSFLLIWYIIFFVLFRFRYSTIFKVAGFFLFAYAFHCYWLKDFFSECAWQFRVNAWPFPVGVAIGYIAEVCNQHFPKWANILSCKQIGWGMGFMSLALYICGAANLIPLSDFHYGLLLFVIFYQVFSLRGLRIGIIRWIGSNSYFIYLIEGKLVGIVSRYASLNASLPLFLVAYAVIMVLLVHTYNYLYKKGSCLLKWDVLPPA